MSIAEKLTTIAENQQKVYDAGYTAGQASGGYDDGFADGKQAEHDAFWESYMHGFETNKTAANYGAGAGWNDENFKPPYPLKVTGDHYMAFARAKITAITEDLIDTSLASSMSYFGYVNSFLKSAVVDAGTSRSVDNMFMSDSYLTDVTIKNILESASTANMLRNCGELTNLVLSGTIGKGSPNLSSSTRLTKASIQNIISVLSTTTSGLSVTLSQTAVNNAFETAEGLSDGSTSTEWTTLVATKSNWTISLA